MHETAPNPSPAEQSPAAPPLAGLKVIDLSRVLAGPYCTMCLGDMGADVIKVERPDGGDDTRRFGPPFVDGVSTYYLAINRNKRSICVDLKSAAGKAVVWRLIEEADVLVENFRPGAMKRLGFDYTAVAARNPRLVYCSISAFGHHGDPAWTGRPGYDLILQGMGGIPSLTGEPDGPPSKVGASIADVVSGMVAYQGVLLALLARHTTGRGQFVDAAMLDGQVSLLAYWATAWLNAQKAPTRMGNRHPSIAPYSTFRTADGWLNVGVANERLWVRFCAALGRPEMADDPRFRTNVERVAHIEALDGAIEAVLTTADRDHWTEVFREAGIPAGPVLTVDQTLAHPQMKARDMVVTLPHPTLGTVTVTGVPTRLSHTPGSVRSAPPLLGEHTDAILAEHGYDAAAIAALRGDGAVG